MKVQERNIEVEKLSNLFSCYPSPVTDAVSLPSHALLEETLKKYEKN